MSYPHVINSVLNEYGDLLRAISPLEENKTLEFIMMNPNIRSKLVNLYLSNLDPGEIVSSELIESIESLAKDDEVRHRVSATLDDTYKPSSLPVKGLPQGLCKLTPKGAHRSNEIAEFHGNEHAATKIICCTADEQTCVVADKGAGAINTASGLIAKDKRYPISIVALANYGLTKIGVSDTIIGKIKSWFEMICSDQQMFASNEKEICQGLANNIERFVKCCIPELNGMTETGESLEQKASLALVITYGGKHICMNTGETNIYNYTGVGTNFEYPSTPETQNLHHICKSDSKAQVLDSSDCKYIVLTTEGVRKGLSSDESLETFTIQKRLLTNEEESAIAAKKIGRTIYDSENSHTPARIACRLVQMAYETITNADAKYGSLGLVLVRTPNRR